MHALRFVCVYMRCLGSMVVWKVFSFELYNFHLNFHVNEQNKCQSSPPTIRCVYIINFKCQLSIWWRIFYIVDLSLHTTAATKNGINCWCCYSSSKWLCNEQSKPTAHVEKKKKTIVSILLAHLTCALSFNRVHMNISC